MFCICILYIIFNGCYIRIYHDTSMIRVNSPFVKSVEVPRQGATRPCLAAESGSPGESYGGLTQQKCWSIQLIADRILVDLSLLTWIVHRQTMTKKQHVVKTLRLRYMLVLRQIYLQYCYWDFTPTHDPQTKVEYAISDGGWTNYGLHLGISSIGFYRTFIPPHNMEKFGSFQALFSVWLEIPLSELHASLGSTKKNIVDFHSISLIKSWISESIPFQTKQCHLDVSFGCHFSTIPILTFLMIIFAYLGMVQNPGALLLFPQSN